jgi:hypothetical protein
MFSSRIRGLFSKNFNEISNERLLNLEIEYSGVEKVGFRKKMKLRKLQFGIATTIILEILSSSKASYASKVDNYFNQFPRNEPPSHLEQKPDLSEVKLVKDQNSDPTFKPDPAFAPQNPKFRDGNPQDSSNNKREVKEIKHTNAINNLFSTALKNQRVDREYQGVKEKLANGENPFNIGKKTSNISSNTGNKTVIIKKDSGPYIVDIDKNNEVKILGIADRSNKQNIKTFKA